MAVWSNQTQNSASWTNQGISSPVISQQFLMIDSTYFLLLDATNKLEIQSSAAGDVWSNISKSSASWLNQTKN